MAPRTTNVTSTTIRVVETTFVAEPASNPSPTQPPLTYDGGTLHARMAAPATEPAEQLPHREPLAAREVDDQRVAALLTLDLVFARQVFRQFGVELELVQVTGPQRIPALLSDRADLAI